MLDGINETGERLLSEPSRQNVIFTKKLFQSLYPLLYHLLFVWKSKRGNLGDPKRPKYRIIKIINDKLDKLAYSVLQKSNDSD